MFQHDKLREKVDALSSTADKVFIEFSAKIGSDQIATRQALRTLGELAVTQDSLRILEIGAGIGTITSFMFSLSLPINVYDALEKDPWCRNEFVKNLGKKSGLNLHPQYPLEEVGNASYNLVIIDDTIEMDIYTHIARKMDSGFIFVEGHRWHQRLAVARKLFRSKRGYSYHHVGRSSDSYKGAGFFVVSAVINSKTFTRYLFHCFTVLRIWLGILHMKARTMRSRIPVRRWFGVFFSRIR